MRRQLLTHGLKAVAVLAVLLCTAGTGKAAEPPKASSEAFSQKFVAPRLGPQQPTPLFRLGGVSFVIWTPLPPPYNSMANRAGAEYPMW